jgi:4-amino-4-deoxy-L-arabinose transferase-like glycosyltransferase
VQRNSSEALFPPIVVVPLMTLLGAIFRVYHLGHKSLWFDEASVFHISRGSLGDVISQSAQGHSAPPLYPLLVNLASASNDSEFSVRIVAAAASILSIPVAYRLFKLFLSRNISYTMTLLVVVAPTHIRHGQELREYALIFLLAGLAYFFFWRFLQRAARRDALALVLVFTLGLLTHYGLALLLLAVVVVVTLSQQWQAGGWGGQGYLSTAYWQGTAGSLLRMLLVNNYALILYTFPGYTATYLPQYFADGFIFVGLVLAGVIALLRNVARKRRTLLFVATPMVVTFAAALLGVYPYHGIRQTFYLNPLVFLLAGMGIAYLLTVTANRPRQRALLNVSVALLLGMGFYYSFRQVETIEPENLRPIAAELALHHRPDDDIFVYRGAWYAFRYYFRDTDIEYAFERDISLEPQTRRLQQVLAGPEDVWIVFSHCGALLPEEGNVTACTILIDFAAQSHTVELVASSHDAMLYRAVP